MEKNLEMCQCGHDEKSHNVRNALPLHGCGTKGCFCQHFVPAPSQATCLCHCHGLKEACNGHTPGKCLIVCEHCLQTPAPSQLSRTGFELDNGTSGTVANTHNETMEKNLEICECGHEKELHYGIPHSPCQFEVDKIYCRCASFRPQKEQWDSKEGQTHYENDGCGEIEHNAPSQPSIKEDKYKRSDCHDSRVWVESYNGKPIYGCERCRKICSVHTLKEVRDEKIARIIKEFREKFGDLAPMIDAATNTGIGGVGTPFSDIYMKDFEAWLTQTLTTLLNEE